MFLDKSSPKMVLLRKLTSKSGEFFYLAVDLLFINFFLYNLKLLPLIIN